MEGQRPPAVTAQAIRDSGYGDPNYSRSLMQPKAQEVCMEGATIPGNDEPDAKPSQDCDNELQTQCNQPGEGATIVHTGTYPYLAPMC